MHMLLKQGIPVLWGKIKAKRNPKAVDNAPNKEYN